MTLLISIFFWFLKKVKKCTLFLAKPEIRPHIFSHHLLIHALSTALLVSFNEDIFGDIRFYYMAGFSCPCFVILCDCGQVNASQSLNCKNRITITNKRVVVCMN